MNKTINLLASVATALLLLVACSAENDGPTDNQSGSTPEVLRNVALTLTPEVPLKVETRGVAYDPNVIKKISIYQFDETGRLVHNSPQTLEGPFSAGSIITVPTLVNTKGKIYIIANPFSDTNISSLEDMETNGFRGVDDEASLVENEVLCMTGFYQGIPTPRMDISLKRTVAEVQFSCTTNLPEGESFKLLSIQVCQVPIKMFYCPVHTEAPKLRSRYFEANLTNSITCMLPENLRGTGRGTNEFEKNAENAPDAYCTYIEVEGQYSVNTSINENFQNWQGNQNVSYRIYLGDNNYNDYNVRRNTRYVINTTIKSFNRADTRITVTGNDAFNKGEYLDYTDNFAPWFAIHSTKYPENYFPAFMPGIDDPTATGADGSICPTGWRMPTTNELMLMYVYNGVVPPDPGYVGEVYLGSEKLFGNYSIYCQMWDDGGEISGRMEYRSTPRGILRCVRDF